MKKLLFITMIASVLSACNLVTKDTHDLYNNIPDTEILIDVDRIEGSGSNEPVNVYVYADDMPVTDADITIDVWWIRESKGLGTQYTAEYVDEGYYTADVEIPHEGVFYVQADINYEHINASPLKYFTVGNIDMFEQMMLQEIASDSKELNLEGHH